MAIPKQVTPPSQQPEPVMVHTWSLMPKDATPGQKAAFWERRMSTLTHLAEDAIRDGDAALAGTLIARARVCQRMALRHRGASWKQSCLDTINVDDNEENESA